MKEPSRGEPHEGIIFVELEGVEPSDSYLIDFKQLNFYKDLLLHKFTAQSPYQRALHLLFIGYKIKHFQQHNQTK